MTSFLPYAKQSINDSDRQAVFDALKSDIITRGQSVEAFERAIAQYCNVPYAVAFNSGTSALMAAYFAARLTSYDRVLSVPNTFIATVGAAIQAGSVPQFVDISCETGNMDLAKLKEKLDFQSTRGRLFVVPVHFAGIAMDMSALSQLLYPYPDSVIIEDAAHAIGSFYPTGQKVGSCMSSDMTIFSFHPAKTITTGEGGIVTTKDPELHHRLQLFRHNGIEREGGFLEYGKPSTDYYEVKAITGNFHLTDFQAALGLNQLRRIERFINKRRNLMGLYRKLLNDVPNVKLLSDQSDERTAFHLCVVQIDFEKYQITRKELMARLKEEGIGTQVHYIPLYYHPVFRKMKTNVEALPEMEKYYSQALSLPLYYELSEADVERVCETLKKILKKNY